MKILLTVSLLLVAVAAAPQQEYRLAQPQQQPLVARRPLLAETQEDELFDLNPSYAFSFNVEDDEFTNYQNRAETQEEGVITGSYSVVDSDGYIRTVKYTAHPEEGFQAEVIRKPTDIKVIIPERTVAEEAPAPLHDALPARPIIRAGALPASPQPAPAHALPARPIIRAGALPAVPQPARAQPAAAQPQAAPIRVRVRPVAAPQQVPQSHRFSVAQVPNRPSISRVPAQSAPAQLPAQPGPLPAQPAPIRFLQQSVPVASHSAAAAPQPAPIRIAHQPAQPAPIRVAHQPAQPAPVRLPAQPAPVRFAAQPAPIRVAAQPAPARTAAAPASVIPQRTPAATQLSAEDPHGIASPALAAVLGARLPPAPLYSYNTPGVNVAFRLPTFQSAQPSA